MTQPAYLPTVLSAAAKAGIEVYDVIVKFNPTGAYTGGFNMTLYDVPADATNTATVNLNSHAIGRAPPVLTFVAAGEVVVSLVAR